MKSNATPQAQAMDPDKKFNLELRAAEAQALMFLLGISLTKWDDGPAQELNDDEKEGIQMLVMTTGGNLKAAVAAISAPRETPATPTA